jgi:hypothetical protein
MGIKIWMGSCLLEKLGIICLRLKRSLGIKTNSTSFYAHVLFGGFLEA